ncbi:phage portal protein [Paracoccus sp. 1_MG-2023]|uniref:phage portal protein n=1 Tax=unclassified Paracoccus (in: a-proteobacteria) TaxID=2688777 RepID=UPI001C09C689|nr:MULTISPECIES: phage portal protein [unclassified Paracoccus (in: a-proteobacteria)]MBU2958626.1 phage portal protein [Paracoccus sp. C2R09]MDO6667619.1 phage portal protein [Paracoccus sp. 1_MG-2023]
MAFRLFTRGERAAAPAPERKASATGRVMAFASGSGRPIWSARDHASLTRGGFMGNPIGFRCVKLIAEAGAAVPLICADTTRRYDLHPVLDLLRRPNPGQGRAELFEALFGQVLLSGNGYLEAAGLAQNGLPEELHVLRSDRMSVVPGADGWPVAYEYQVGGRKHRFDMTGSPDPICHLRSFHPSDDHYGLSPMQAAAVAVDVHNSASAWSKALLDNAARPSGAIVYGGVDGQGTLSPEQYDRLVGEIEMNHQGARNAGRPMLLEGGLDWKPMGFSPSDMEFHETKLAAAREIALAFGVPPMLLGIPGDATYANYAEAHRAFYRLTVLPLATRVAAGVAWWLSEHLGAEIELRPDPDQVPALAEERDRQWTRVAQAGFLTDAEKRQLLGLPPIDEA